MTFGVNETHYEVGDRVRFNARHAELFDKLREHDDDAYEVESVHDVRLEDRRRVGHHQCLVLKDYKKEPNWFISGCLVDKVEKEVL